MIATREAVRAAVQRAMKLNPSEDCAVHAVAQAMGLAPEAVRDALQAEEAEAAS